MAGLGILDDRRYVIGEQEFRIILPVKYKKELMFRMLCCNTFQGLIGKPTDSFEFVLD
jgi:hypothetical protein